MTDFEKILAENTPPAPRADLSDRILATAQTVKPANDTPKLRPIWAFGSVAVLAIAAFFLAQPMMQADPETVVDTQWAEAAETVGFADLYDWVENEPTDLDG